MFGPSVTKTAGSSNRVVYVIDSGIADHADLNMHPTFPRVNVACGSGGDCDTVGSASDRAQYPLVGCYGHATHVAGIIGASANSAGTVGVYAGVKMRSVSVVGATDDYRYGAGSPLGVVPPTLQDPDHNTMGWCGNLKPNTATIGYAFDWIYNRILFDEAGVGIVNMSINTGAMGFHKDIFGVYTTEANNPRINRLTTPATVPIGFGFDRNYPGAFFAQSAGNQFIDACRNCDGGGQVSNACPCAQG